MKTSLSVKDLLHQRAPHLWVDEILESSLSKIIGRVSVSENHPTIQSHFPGAPVVPGSIVQEMCTQTAACLLTEYHVAQEQRKDLAIGVLMRIHDAKFKGFVRPPETCHIHVELLSRALAAYRFKAKVETEDGTLIAKFHFIGQSRALHHAP